MRQAPQMKKTALSQAGCSASTIHQIRIVDAIEDEESPSQMLQLYPNPADHCVHVYSMEGIRIHISDVMCKQITETQTIGANQTEIVSIEQLPAGIYQWIASNLKGNSCKRFEVIR